MSLNMLFTPGGNESVLGRGGYQMQIRDTLTPPILSRYRVDRGVKTDWHTLQNNQQQCPLPYPSSRFASIQFGE